ncbi:MAG TPA: hypothetical protein VK857_03165, partial [Desulforhopalus sp.]|nr:hypothetical protein [Desulforhopalus sp.]
GEKNAVHQLSTRYLKTKTVDAGFWLKRIPPVQRISLSYHGRLPSPKEDSWSQAGSRPHARGDKYLHEIHS